MTALKTLFDGKQIVVPPELAGAAAQEVVIVVQRPAPTEPAVPRGTSIFDIPPMDGPGRTAEEIIAQVRADRDEWGDR